MRELILDIIDRSLERSKKEGRLRKAKELNRDLLTKQVKEQILITRYLMEDKTCGSESLMEVVDRAREERVERARRNELGFLAMEVEKEDMTMEIVNQERELIIDQIEMKTPAHPALTKN